MHVHVRCLQARPIGPCLFVAPLPAPSLTFSGNDLGLKISTPWKNEKGSCCLNQSPSLSCTHFQVFVSSAPDRCIGRSPPARTPSGGTSTIWLGQDHVFFLPFSILFYPSHLPPRPTSHLPGIHGVIAWSTSCFDHQPGPVPLVVNFTSNFRSIRVQLFVAATASQRIQAARTWKRRWRTLRTRKGWMAWPRRPTWRCKPCSSTHLARRKPGRAKGLR